MSPDFNVELEPLFAALSNTYSADRYLFHAMHFIRDGRLDFFAATIKLTVILIGQQLS